MAKLVKDASLTSVANAIREKTGGTDPLIFPGGFVSAIEGITTGGGATEPYIEETYDAQGQLTGAVLHGYTKIRDHAFDSCTELALTSLPSGVTSIGAYVFYNCTSLTISFIPNGVTNIDHAAFARCTGLTSITFEGTPTTIDQTAFDGCTNLTDIKVPWAEGAVANAPWGATNATITYNYTGEGE